MNAFFLKYVLYIPPSHTLNVYRLVFWFAISLPATREYYAYATDRHTKRLGPNLWLAIACIVVEVAVVLKFAAETPFPPGAHIPLTVVACWAVAGAAFASWCFLKYGHFSRQLLLGTSQATVMNLLITTAVAAMAYLAISQDVGWGLRPPPPT
jgi:hypothetical protein